ncbi:MAG: MCP four helix bundle domain-containing protein [Lachnospiraceae bacterium]|nr:MCP four helix bundle domain-containing protein [Lachnospiraceae bacterium]
MTALRHMNIRKRLIVSFTGVLVIASFASILSILLIWGLNSRYSRALELNGFIQGEIGEYNTYLNRGGAMVRDIIMLTDQNDINEAKASLEECDEKVEYYLNLFESKVETDEERVLLADIKKEYSLYIEKRQEAIELGTKNHNEEGISVFRDEAAPHLKQIMDDSEQLLALNVEMGDSVSNTLGRLSLIMLIVIAVCIIIAALTSMRFAFYTANDIEEPLLEIKEAIRKMSDGELDVHLKTDRENEFGELEGYFNKSIAKLHSYLECIDYGLEEIGKGNFQVRPNVEFHGEFIRIKEAIENIIIRLNGTIRQIDDGAGQVAAGAGQLSLRLMSLPM